MENVFEVELSDVPNPFLALTAIVYEPFCTLFKIIGILVTTFVVVVFVVAFVRVYV
jgi:hypothetical protein